MATYMLPFQANIRTNGHLPVRTLERLLLLSPSLLACVLPRSSSIGIRAWCGSACGCAESVAAAREARLWSLELGKEESIFRGDFSLLLELALPTTGATDLGHCREQICCKRGEICDCVKTAQTKHLYYLIRPL